MLSFHFYWPLKAD